MMLQDADAIKQINHLIETARDGEEGFKTAANAAKDPSLKEMFTNYAQQRARFVEELQLQVRRLGGDPGKRGSIAGALHRGWMNVKSMVAGSTDDALIREAERGEDVAVKAFQDALAMELPVDVQPIVERQYLQVKEAHDRISALEKTLQPAAQ
jgi:uncharacterized protein (TIGR02284 family)